MSTEVIKQSREELIEEILNSNPDMLDEFNENEIADLLLTLGLLLGTKKGRVVAHKLIKYSDRGNKEYTIKVRNVLRGSVSVSDDCSTGVSETLYYPFFTDGSHEDEWYAGYLSLLDMINEAWYNLKNG